MEPQPLVVLTGPPGAGKTTVASHLLDSASLAVHVHGDDFWHYIAKGAIPPHLEGSHRQNEVVTVALGAAAPEFAAVGYLTVLETILGPWLLGHAVAAAATRGVTVSYFVLRPSPDVAMGRAVARVAGELRGPAPVRKMYEAFANLGSFEQYVSIRRSRRRRKRLRRSSAGSEKARPYST